MYLNTVPVAELLYLPSHYCQFAYKIMINGLQKPNILIVSKGDRDAVADAKTFN